MTRSIMSGVAPALCAFLVSLALAWPSQAADPAVEADLWQALRSGEAAVLMRHALAPGTGDPSNFDLDDCTTQRNLSDTGREQARMIGELFRANGISAAAVYSSRWCRCMDTAELLALGDVTPFDGINSFFRNRAEEPNRTAATLALLRERTVPGEPPPVLVTHQVNITALTGVFPGSGSLLFVRPDGDALSVLGRIDTR
jgi:phosphohistidine phosphatase SixA